ncbi:hypothetical protein Tco_1343464 [Tanacetum coccineum]
MKRPGDEENILSTETCTYTDKEKYSTNKEKVSTDRPIVSTDGSKVSTDKQIEGTDEQIKSTDEQRKGTENHTEEESATQATQTPTSIYIIWEMINNTRSLKKYKPYMRRLRGQDKFYFYWSAEDENKQKRMNEKGIDSPKIEVGTRRVREEVSGEESKEKKVRERENLLHGEKRVYYEILDRKYPIKEWKTECLGTKPQADKAEHLEEINQNVVIRSNGQKRYFSTLKGCSPYLRREDLECCVHCNGYIQDEEILNGFDSSTFGDLNS